MKKTNLISLFIFPFSLFIIQNSSAQSPNWLWAKGMGGISHDYSSSIAVDAFGSVYTTGTFMGTVDFDPGTGTFNLTSTGQGDIFISKLDSSGNFEWAKAIGGTDNDESTSIAIDPAGGVAIYTTGNFEGTIDFDPGVGTFNLTSSGQGDIFISKLDSSGNFVWAKAIGGTSDERGFSIAIDPGGSGNVYITGNFEGTIDFDPGAGTFNLTAVGAQAIFVSKLDSSGNFVWAKAAGGISNGAYGIAVALDAPGNVYVTGGFFNPVTIGSTTLINAGGVYSDIFIARIESTTTITGNNETGNFDKDILLSPNPLSNSTTIFFSLTQSQKISLKIFDLNGRLVSTLADKIFEAGENKIVWDAENVNAGVYFLQFQTTEKLHSEKLIVTK